MNSLSEWYTFTYTHSKKVHNDFLDYCTDLCVYVAFMKGIKESDCMKIFGGAHIMSNETNI